MKTLVVYYSLQGNTRALATRMAEALGCDLLEIKPVKDIKKKGFLRIITGSRQAKTKAAPALEPLDRNAADYDLLFIGAPTRAFTFAPPLRTFFRQAGLRGKKIGLFCSCWGSAPHVFEDMREELAGNDILGESAFIHPPRTPTGARAEEAAQWAVRMAEAAGYPVPDGTEPREESA